MASKLNTSKFQNTNISSPMWLHVEIPIIQKKHFNPRKDMAKKLYGCKEWSISSTYTCLQQENGLANGDKYN